MEPGTGTGMEMLVPRFFSDAATADTILRRKVFLNRERRKGSILNTWEAVIPSSCGEGIERKSHSKDTKESHQKSLTQKQVVTWRHGRSCGYDNTKLAKNWETERGKYGTVRYGYRPWYDS